MWEWTAGHILSRDTRELVGKSSRSYCSRWIAFAVICSCLRWALQCCTLQSSLLTDATVVLSLLNDSFCFLRNSGWSFILVTIMRFFCRNFGKKKRVVSKYSQRVKTFTAAYSTCFLWTFQATVLEEFAWSDAVCDGCQEKCEGWCASNTECSNEQHHIYSNFCLEKDYSKHLPLLKGLNAK